MKLISLIAVFSSYVQCYNSGYESYEQRNTKNCERTVSGKSCLSWDSERLDPTVKCGFGRVAFAGCANPDNDPRGPWCYTSFATKDNWEYCHQICARHDVCEKRPQNILPTPATPSNNDGKCTQTVDGVPCRNWKESVNMSDRPATQRWMRSQDNNFCANPDNDTKGNWCFTDTPRRSAFSSTDNYGYCAETCQSKIVQPTRQSTRQWTRSTRPSTTPTTTSTTTSTPIFAKQRCSETTDGRRCRNWQMSIYMSTQESTRSWMRSQNNNFCANPDNDPKGDWCFAEASFGSNNFGYCQSDCGSRRVSTTISTTIRTTPTRPPPFRWTTRRQTTKTTRRSPERLAPVRVPSSNDKPICAPMNDDPFYFRDDDGEERRPDIWEQPDEIPRQSRDDRFRSEQRKSLRILEGNEATVGQIPWQVQLIGRSACGGTIVASRIVVTAQHCLENAMDPRRWMVQAGHIKKNSRGSGGAQKRGVIKILNTGTYNSPRKHNNDIAIMVTDEPFQFNHLVKPACLPPKNFKPIGGECIISGWGHTSYRGRSSNELLWTLVPLIPRNICGRQLRERLTENMICGGGSGPDTCQGDSGGPLVCALRHPSGDKQYILVGITSFGHGCGNTPGVYTEVADYLDWINGVISEYP